MLTNMLEVNQQVGIPRPFFASPLPLAKVVPSETFGLVDSPFGSRSR